MLDVIIVGGGPAGLAAALTLGRAHRSVQLLDSGEYRNAPAEAVHNFVFHDGTPPAELRRMAHAELAAYPTVEIRRLAVINARSTPEGFEVRLSDHSSVRARRLVLATGLTDEVPSIAGLAELWGRSAFHCPYCHGFEVSHRRIAVKGGDAERVRLALHLRRFSDDVVLCTNAEHELDAQSRRLLALQGVAIRTERIARFVHEALQLQHIEFIDGSSLARDAVFIRTRMRQRSNLPARLGCATLADGLVEVNDVGQTTMPGVYAVGDMARRVTMPGPAAAVVAAAASGTMAAGAIDQDLLSADMGLPFPFARPQAHKAAA